MSTLSPKAETLVRAGRRAYQPTAADRERLLHQLRSQLGDAALPPDMNTATAAAAATGSTWPLISAVVVGVGMLGGALFYAWPRGPQPHPPRMQTAPAVVTSQVVAPAASPAVTPPTVTAAPPADPTEAPPAIRSQDRLAAEVALLSRATRDLRAGRPVEALKALEDYRRKFPKGLLGDEHRAARVQALCALGRFDEAEAKLAELPPQSPLALRAKQFCDASSGR